MTQSSSSHPNIRADRFASAIASLPWDTPLADWPRPILVGLPRGISRHVVRFVELEGHTFAVKETQAPIAVREYEMLSALRDLDVPAVAPLGYVTDRVDPEGKPLPACLITPHLTYSLPYRALFTRDMVGDPLRRLVDALAVLLVRLHLVGFFWGDVSLSNTLIRRDAETYAAYLVDAETGELHQDLSEGQRLYDLELARTNIAGDFLDLQAGGLVDPNDDPLSVSNYLFERYTALWTELTKTEVFNISDRWRIDERVRRLNRLGFDLGELTVTTDIDGVTVRIEPKVVEPGHHRRRLHRLTGITAEENQAQHLLNDLDSYRSATVGGDLPERAVAQNWLEKVYEPVVNSIPLDLEDRLEPPQVFHEFLDHQLMLSERAGQDVGIDEALSSYVNTVLKHLRAESTYVRSLDNPPPEDEASFSI